MAMVIRRRNKEMAKTERTRAREHGIKNKRR
jgi:hypothetical protein